MNLAGKFIVLDGPDGCGKSTQANLLAKWIQDQGIEAVSFRDPGTTVIGEAIRNILLGHDYEGMGDNVEVLLYMAARAQLWIEKISPALDEGKCVIMDRWLSSTCAYQGKAGGFGIENVIKLANDCLERSWPDLTLILDLDLSTSSSRMNRTLDRMEVKGDKYHSNVRDGYIELVEIANDESKREELAITCPMQILNASKDIKAVHNDVIEAVNLI